MNKNKTPSIKNDNISFSYNQVHSGKILTEDYQRPLNKARVNKIVQNFNPLLVNVIKVSNRDGKYYVFDGQHTLNALVTKNGGKSLNVECKIYTGLMKEDEARLFAEQNGVSSAVCSSEKVKALYIANDIDVLEMKETIERLGIIFDFTTSTSERKIVCVSTVYSIAKNDSCAKLEEILKIILEAWKGENGSLRKEIINAVYLFDKKYTDRYSTSELIRKLKNISPAKIIRNGAAMITGGNARYARQILLEYNKGKRNRLDDIF